MKNLMILPTLILIFVFIVMLNALNIALPVSVTTSNKASELSVIGEGKVDVVPDVATISLGVSITNGATTQAVQKSMSDINNKIVASAEKFGVKKEDIKTSNYSIYPNMVYENNQSIERGYNGNINVSVKVRNISVVSQVQEAATAAGANQINGVDFSVDSPEKYREAAREKAIANAKDQAEKLAKNLGIKLGKVTNIVESTSATDNPIMYDRAMSMSASAGFGGGGTANIEPGNQTISSVVTLYFEKK